MFNTALKRQLEAQRLEIARQGALVEAIDRSTARIEFTPDGVVVSANPCFLDALKYRADEVVGQPHKMFCPPELVGSSAYRDQWERLRRGEVVSGRFKRVAKGGGTVWLQATYNPVFGAKREVVGIVKLATDITEQIAAEESQRSLLAAIDRSMATIEFALDGTILAANENFLRTVGYAAGEVIGRHHRLFCDSETANSPAYVGFWQRLGRGEFVSGQFRRLGKGGREVWLEATYNPILDVDGKVLKVVKFASDITERV